jgi:hypothetical protein
LTDEEKGKLNAEVSRGQEARAILDAPLVMEARAKIEAQMVRAWKDTTKTSEDRECVWRQWQAFDQIWAHLTEILQTGRMADFALPEKERRGLWRRIVD